MFCYNKLTEVVMEETAIQINNKMFLVILTLWKNNFEATNYDQHSMHSSTM